MPKPIKPNLSPYQQFVRRWQDCTKCELCKVRKTVVLCRGKLPADVMFVAEAPGMSEDVLGEPLVGPAGQLFDRIIDEAGGRQFRLAFTNIVCCIPKVEGVKAGEPPKWAVEACASRLREFAWLAKPKLVVLVGDHAKKAIVGQANFSKNRDCPESDDLWLPPNQFMDFCEVVHPARLLRLRSDDPVRASLEYRRCVVALADAFEILRQKGLG